MTLELNQVAPQVKAMGQSLEKQIKERQEAVQEALALLQEFSTEHDALHSRIVRAERAQKRQRFDWIGAMPTTEALAQAYALPSGPQTAMVIGSDGSQILPDRHDIASYYLINIGSIVYRHGSNQKPEVFKQATLTFEPEDITDELDQLIAPGVVNVKRDLAELQILADLAPKYIGDASEPVICLIDGRLTLRVIDLPFAQQEEAQKTYIESLNKLRDTGAIVAGYIDRPRSTFVVNLLHLASLDPETINEETLSQKRFPHLTDTDIFNFLEPGERSAVFATRTKGTEKYEQAGHAIYFFYLNVSRNPANPNLVRVEIPVWLTHNPAMLNSLHALLMRQADMYGGYPYVLARAHELAVVAGAEREAFNMMLAVEMRQRGMNPTASLKQTLKTLPGK